MTKKYLKQYRRYSYIKSVYLRIIRRFAQSLYLQKKKFGIFNKIKNHRTFNNEGLIVALIGADGSGKSTQVKILLDKLSTKIDSRFVIWVQGTDLLAGTEEY